MQMPLVSMKINLYIMIKLCVSTRNLTFWPNNNYILLSDNYMIILYYLSVSCHV